ncbi:MAG: TldD/PmbA family protein [Deltaproteobacteria bacterium]|nr:TldD/PmbA family protein [Deltaproteobacteria bacterium]
MTRYPASTCDQLLQTFERSSSLGVEIKDGKLDHLSRATDQGLSIRCLKESRMGFAYTFDLARNAVELACRRALEVGELMPVDPLNDLCTTGNGGGFKATTYPKVNNYDGAGLEVSLEKKIELARSIEADVKAADPRIKRVRKAAFDEIQGESILVDHLGNEISHRMTIFSGDVTCVAEDGASAETGYDSRYSSSFDKLETDKIAPTAAAEALELLHAGKAATGQFPAVFKNSVVAQLVGFLSASFSAENIDKNFSLLVGKKGEKVFSDRINLIDDGLLEGGTSTGPFDGEGYPTRRTPLVRAGVVESFLYDSYYARKHRTATTGNSRRGSLKAPPGVGSTNLYLEKGAKSFDALVKDAGRGIFITDLLGLHTANPVTGEFSVGASGILIEGGRLTKPVKGFAIAGNLVELLRDVAEVGSDLRFWGGVGAPSFLVSKLNVSGS